MKYLGGGAQVGVILQRGLDSHLVADQQELEAVVATAGECGALDHHAHALIPAHRVDGDTREGHRACPGLTGLEPDRDDLAPVVMAAGRAEVVRALELTAIAALVEGLYL